MAVPVISIVDIAVAGGTSVPRAPAESDYSRLPR